MVCGVSWWLSSAPTGFRACRNPITFQTHGGNLFRDGAVNPIGPQSGIITLTRSAIDAQVKYLFQTS